MLKKISLFSIIVIPLIFSFGYSSSKEMNFAKADAIINNDVANGFGGAVLLVIDGDKIVKQSAYGYQAMFKPDCETSADYNIPKNCYLADKDRTLMNTDTIFDLASLTKVYSTVMAMMHLSYISKLDINKPVAFFI